MTTITPELKTFMEDLWGAEGDFINTPIGRGRIENVRTKAGIDLEVIVKILIWRFPLFNGMELLKWSVSNDPDPQRTYWHGKNRIREHGDKWEVLELPPGVLT